MRSSLISLEFRRRRETSKMKRSPHPCGQGAGEGESLPRTSHPATVSQPTPRDASFQVRSSTSEQPPSGHPRTHTHAHIHARWSHARHPDTGGGPAPLPPSVFCLSLDFILTCRCFPMAGEGGGYNGGYTMSRKRYGKK